jgi:hypothetical protein
MNKIYLLLVIDDNRDIDVEEYSKTGHVHRIKGNVERWILNDDIGIDTISGFTRSEEQAKKWALERCKRGEELPDRPVSEKIVPFEKLIYVDHQCVLVEPGRWEKHVQFRGYRREDLELPVFGYLELSERAEE